MDELEFSIMVSEPDPNSAEEMQRLLAQFEAEHRVRVRLTVFPWTKGWEELVKVALYGHGPDLSEVGSTWVSSLIGMRALQPFTERDVQLFGGTPAFLPQAWRSCFLAGEGQTWAIPWLAGTRLIFYRRDLLEKAGVDERTAFQTHQHLEQTLERLRASGVTMPWVVPTQPTLNTLHRISSWVWGAGGDFITADGKGVLFNHEEACTGMSQYFGLSRYLPREFAGHLDEVTSDRMFWQGQAAATITGHWMVHTYAQTAAPDVMANLGMALVPGVSFVGGSNLVIWQHARHKIATVELARFLVSKEVQIRYSQCIRLLPARMEALNALYLSDDPFYALVSRGLKSGRSFPSTRLWGLVEDKLTITLGQIWASVLADPDNPNPIEIVSEHLNSLADRLSLTLNPT